MEKRRHPCFSVGPPRFRGEEMKRNGGPREKRLLEATQGGLEHLNQTLMMMEDGVDHWIEQCQGH